MHVSACDLQKSFSFENTVEITRFWISQGKVATAGRWGKQIYKPLMLNFLRISHLKSLKLVNFKTVIQKIQKVNIFLGHSVFPDRW